MTGWRSLVKAKTRKLECSYICQERGSDKDIQAHHYNGRDNDCIVVLCGKCHAAKHPDLSPDLFVNHHLPSERQLMLDNHLFRDRMDSKSWFVFGDVLVDRKTHMWRPLNDCLGYDAIAMQCKMCGSSTIHKDGTRKVRRNGRIYTVQAFLCSDCLHQWRDNQ